ncbi:helix-turn-helix transcriptional regulator [Aerococcus sanguinicola]|uniref:Helix-turn-helix domain-containing protein n=1 Tax=Aerococcus sanguinicola TaxID=119206 RepID=A0A0X8FBQ2_9LACT|nr:MULTISPECIES: helix-turn-helix domain-containing protein [Aerococcus]AMB94409.1 transcription regulator [Aerococcus sanguinicola]MDK7051097.1 helix-turn-helix domain-containing protein [Aerococcus sanguinicola]OFT94079.1 transcriptional regulator [Aerococcus sp. HMSC23C02]PKZ20732.1 helix-turn-helix domain-containing protein [Aerococcus sanguinicola]
MNLLKGYRNALGMTQADMASELGISRQSYYMKEKGRVAFTDKEKIIVLSLFHKIDEKLTIDQIFFTHKVGK